MANMRFSSREMMLVVALIAIILGLWRPTLQQTSFLESFQIQPLLERVAVDQGWTQNEISGSMNSFGPAGKNLTRHRVGKVFVYRCAWFAGETETPLTSRDWSKPLWENVLHLLDESHCSIDYKTSAKANDAATRISYHQGNTQGELAILLVDDSKGRVVVNLSIIEFKR